MTRIIRTDEAEWSPIEKVWAGIQTFPARKAGQVSSWWLVAAAVLILAVVGRLA